MNFVYSSIDSRVETAPHVAVPQVMNSDAALMSVIIPETKDSASHFHISVLLKGRHRTVKVAAMVDSGATGLFLDKKYADSHKMLQIPLKNPI
jgi:predicted aspartyl protease